MGSVNKGKGTEGKEAKEVQIKPDEPTKKQFLFDWKATKNGSTDCNYFFDSKQSDGVEVDVRSSNSMATFMVHLYFERHLFEKEKHQCNGEFEFHAKKKDGKDFQFSFPFVLSVLDWNLSRYTGTSIVFSDTIFPDSLILDNRSYEIRVWKSEANSSSSLSQSLLQMPFDFSLTGFDEDEKIGIHKIVAEANFPPVQMRSSTKMTFDDSASTVFHLGFGKKSSVEFVKYCCYHGCGEAPLPEDLSDAYLVTEYLLYEPAKKYLKNKICEHIRNGQIKLEQAETIRKQFKDVKVFTEATCFAAAKKPEEYMRIRENAKK